MMHRVHIILALLFLLLRSVLPAFAQEEEEPEVYEPPRDYGIDWRPSVLLGLTPEDGILVGGGPILYKFGFRQMPYLFRMQLVAEVGLKTGVGKVEYTALFPSLSERFSMDILAHISSLEVRNFYGFGNNTQILETVDETTFYRVALREYLAHPRLFYRITNGVKIGVGVFYKHAQVREKEGRYITADSLAVLGDDKSFVGSSLLFEVDTRDAAVAATSGMYLAIQGKAFHPFENRVPFQRLSVDTRLFLTLPSISSLTLGLRAGGEKLHGEFPFYESAFLGGLGSLRGFNSERFAGDASLAGNVDLRLSLFRMKLLVPAMVSIFGFVDAGRVWWNDESPEGWHIGSGGGISLAPIGPENTISLTFANSKDGLFVLAGFGFGF